MKHLKAVVGLAAILTLSAAAAPALAYGYGHHGRHFHHYRHSGVHFGFVFQSPGYWYYPYYRAPVVAVPVPASPPVYIERSDTQAAPASPAYWYYCVDAKAYYPYVKECPGGWQRVVPQQPAG